MKLTLDGMLAALRLKAHGIADGLTHRPAAAPHRKVQPDKGGAGGAGRD
ncbi:MAG: hypothetical protein KDJ73_10265 [Notoacmeibacter sp.]|nr:hypothetical protein [Notoacmeibacter sp.]